MTSQSHWSINLSQQIWRGGPVCFSPGGTHSLNTRIICVDIRYLSLYPTQSWSVGWLHRLFVLWWVLITFRSPTHRHHMNVCIHTLLPYHISVCVCVQCFFITIATKYSLLKFLSQAVPISVSCLWHMIWYIWDRLYANESWLLSNTQTAGSCTIGCCCRTIGYQCISIGYSTKDIWHSFSAKFVQTWAIE